MSPLQGLEARVESASQRVRDEVMGVGLRLRAPHGVSAPGLGGHGTTIGGWHRRTKRHIAACPIGHAPPPRRTARPSKARLQVAAQTPRRSTGIRPTPPWRWMRPMRKSTRRALSLFTRRRRAARSGAEHRNLADHDCGGERPWRLNREGGPYPTISAVRGWHRGRWSHWGW